MDARLSPESLRYVVGVGERGSFSAAARALGASQPALSTAVARLESQLGGALFERGARGVRPTPFGLAMLPLIHQAVEAQDAVLAESRRWHSPFQESLRIGVSPLIGSELVARIHTASQEHPPLPATHGLVLREANLEDLRTALVADELDLIVVPSVAPMAQFRHRVIDSEPVVLVDPHRADGEVVLSELAGMQLILMPDTCGLTTFTQGLLRENALPTRTYPGEATSYRVLEEWSNLGLGAAMLPLSRISDPATRHHRVREGDGTEVDIFYEAIWSPRSPLASALEKIADALVQPVGRAAGQGASEPGHP